MSNVTPRRSMVGAPPSSLSSSKTIPKVVLKVSRKRKEEEPLEESDCGSERNDGGNQNMDLKRKKRILKKVDSNVKAKRRAEKKIETENKKKEEAVLEEESGSDDEVEEAQEDEEEEEHVVKQPSLNQYSPIQLLFDHILRRLMDKDSEEYFHYPVTAAIAPDYNNIIKNPMDLQTMREKIDKNVYTNLQEFKEDAKLIVSNARTYNAPHTVYNVAAQRLGDVIDYYTGDLYLKDCSQRLAFASLIDWNSIGIEYRSHDKEKKKGLITVEPTAEEIIKGVNENLRERLSARLPNAPKLAFIDNKNGCTMLNVIGDQDKGKAKLIHLIGRLEEGTPGIFAPCDTKLIGRSPISYMNYGSFCSFAPHLDSTWSTMKKNDSDLLLRTYGDKSLASDSIGMRNFVSNADSFVKLVDEMLDKGTDGEHSRCMNGMNNRIVDSSDIVNLSDDLDDIESLTNLGFDVSFLSDIRRDIGMKNGRNDMISSQLDSNGRCLMDMVHLQNERLSCIPPVSLSRSIPPSHREVVLAGRANDGLIEQIAKVQPQDIMNANAVHDSLGLDMDILSEFFTV